MPISTIVASTGVCRSDVVRTRCVQGTRLQLVREPRNPIDVHTIAVKIPGPLGLFGTKVGNLKANLAKQLAPLMDAGARPSAYVASVYAPPTFQHPSLSITIEMRELDDHPALARTQARAASADPT